MRRSRFLSIVVATVLALAGTVAGLGTVGVALAACVKQVAWTDHVPQAAADGARMEWLARVTHAPDWADGGFASQVLWVGTDNDQADTSWVEVGLTHGFAGDNDWTFYSARALNGGGYLETRFTTFNPGSGVKYRFSAYFVSTTYVVNIRKISDGSSVGKGWAGHSKRTVNYSGGPEATCNTARIDRTYVSVNQFRRQSDGVWVNINNGSLVKHFTDPDGDIRWCAQPTRFRYYLNSSIDKTLCS